MRKEGIGRGIAGHKTCQAGRVGVFLTCRIGWGDVGLPNRGKY